jgi:hypothetical protein
MSGDIADGRVLVLVVVFEGGLVHIDMLEELLGLVVVDALQLL